MFISEAFLTALAAFLASLLLIGFMLGFRDLLRWGRGD